MQMTLIGVLVGAIFGAVTITQGLGDALIVTLFAAIGGLIGKAIEGDLNIDAVLHFPARRRK